MNADVFDTVYSNFQIQSYSDSIGALIACREPLPPDSRLWRHPKVLVSPHLGGFHRHYADQVVAAITDNLTRYLRGGTPALVNRMN